VSLHDGDEAAKGLRVEMGRDDDATSIRKDEFEVGWGSGDRRDRVRQDGDREEMRVGTGGGAIVAGGGLGRAGLIEVLAEGMERDLAAAAELGLSQAAAAEILEEGVPAEIDGAASRHGVVSPTGPLAPPEESSPGVTRLCRCTSPDGHGRGA
jgi:hypothetical protein